MAVKDEISWRRNWKPDFDTKIWKVWIEHVCDESTFCERAKKLNPNVEAKSTYLLKHLNDCLSELTEKSFSVQEPDAESNQFTLYMKSKLPAGIPFSWKFYCSPGKHQMMKDLLVSPLLSMVGELQRRQEELIKILKKKDYEIEEYKNSGAVLSRKSFETQPFLLEDFTKRMTVSQEFVKVVENCAERACQEENQDLFEQVMIKRKWIDFQNTPVLIEDGTLETSQDSLGFGLLPTSSTARSSWDTKIPPSLLAEAQTSPTKRSPPSSPGKSSKNTSPEKSPSQDTELQRREDLRKRLAEEADKKKSKKRKKLKI